MEPLVTGLLIGIGIGLIVFGFVGVLVGITVRKATAEREIGGAEEEARRILNEAMKGAETKMREALIEAKDEIHKQRIEYDREVKERRIETRKQEDRLRQKEENLDRKTDALERKDEQLTSKLRRAEELREEAEKLRKGQLDVLERISGFSRDEAKQYLLDNLQGEITHEAAAKIRESEARVKDECDKKAREVVSLAIQRCASEYVSEVTVSVVALPGDEMKGRIIGREGRNIRTLETLTGVDLIIDDTPEAITLSGQDPVRREIARIALEKLISDGRIHPARIEEMVEKARREVEMIIKQEGERAVFETGVHGIHPELVRLLGRMKYRTSFTQNVLRHSIEVSHLAGIMAGEIGADVKVAKRAGLLHDVGKALDREVEGTHIQIGVDLARKYRENPAVIHAIEAHHGDVEAKTIEACLVQAADAISAARPGARKENVENYVKRLEKLEETANSFEGVERCFAVQAGREIRVMVKPETISDDDMVVLSRELIKKIEHDLDYPGQIRVNIIREKRLVDYAK